VACKLFVCLPTTNTKYRGYTRTWDFRYFPGMCTERNYRYLTGKQAFCILETLSENNVNHFKTWIFLRSIHKSNI